MNERKEITFKPTVFSKEHKIILDPEFIEFYNDENDANPVRFSKFEIDGFRFGLRRVSGYQFYIGRVYCVDIKSVTSKTISIRFKTMYKINLKQIHEKYSIAINTVFKYYFHDTVFQYVNMFNNKQTFSILSIQFDQKGILITNKNEFINWEEIEIKPYTRYFTILSKSKQDFYKTFDYMYEWNAWVLYTIIKQILHNKP
jgi:hypothetical protein